MRKIMHLSFGCALLQKGGIVETEKVGKTTCVCLLFLWLVLKISVFLQIVWKVEINYYGDNDHEEDDCMFLQIR